MRDDERHRVQRRRVAERAQQCPVATPQARETDEPHVASAAEPCLET